ncbi:MAG: 6-phosphofructokinase, partial [Chloroflexi bacterium]
LDRLRTTASAHHRVVVVEAMGRDTGWVAAFGGLAGGADLVLVPEIRVTSDDVTRTVKRRRSLGDLDILVVVSEAAEIDGLEAQTAVDRDAFGHVRLDQRAIGAVLARHIEQRTGIEARQVVLGHLQRGGSPTAVDRLRATRFGNAAADLAIAVRRFAGILD